MDNPPIVIVFIIEKLLKMSCFCSYYRLYFSYKQAELIQSYQGVEGDKHARGTTAIHY